MKAKKRSSFMKPNTILCIILFSCFSIINLQGMATNFTSPTPLFAQPRMAGKKLKTFELTIAHNHATKSFDHQGNTVCLLNYDGPITLYQLDATTKKIIAHSQSIVDAIYKSFDCYLRFSNNFNNHWFIDLVFKGTCESLCEISLQSIQSLSNPTSDLSSSLASQKQAQKIRFGEFFVTAGYTTCWQHFEKIDFVDFCAQAGITATHNPVEFISLEFDTYSNTLANPILFTVQNSFHPREIGFPIQINAAVGCFDWLTMGVTGIVTMYAPTYRDCILTGQNSTDDLIKFIDTYHLRQGPLWHCNGYLLADHLIPRTNIWLGLSYTQQTCGKIHKKKLDQNSMLHPDPLIPPFKILDLYVACEINPPTWQHRNHLNLPRMKISYTHPLWGRTVFKTRNIAGQLGCEFKYDF